MTVAERCIDSDLINMLEGAKKEPALFNEFYTRWVSAPLSPPAFEIFAANYFARTQHTSSMVALSFLSATDLEAKTEIAKNLYSEFGFGDSRKAHINLLRVYVCDLLERLYGRKYSYDDLRKIQVLPSTDEFTRAQHALYHCGVGTCDRSRVLGAHLAQEWIAYTMLTQLYEGARNYRHLYAHQDEFHECCEYFYAHIGEGEKSHREQALFAAARQCKSDADLEAMLASSRRFLDITADFWCGLAVAIRGK